MTVSELAKYFSDRTFFKDPDQEVKFVLAPVETYIEKGETLELRGSVVPAEGAATVAFRPAPPLKYTFRLAFEAVVDFEARSLEEASAKAKKAMADVGVIRFDTRASDMRFVRQDPSLLEETEERRSTPRSRATTSRGRARTAASADPIRPKRTEGRRSTGTTDAA